MADQVSNGAATGSGPDPGAVRAAAAGAVAPDAITAELLAKHSAGQRLTQSGYGKVGAWKAKLNKFFGNGGAAPGPAQPGAAVGNAAAMAPVASGQAPAGGLAPVEIDPGFASRTTHALLRRTDAIAGRLLGNAARKAGADDGRVARFERAAAMHPDDKALLADLSPDVLRSLGYDPRHYPLTVAASIMGLYATDLWLLVLELKALQQKPLASAPLPGAPPTVVAKTTKAK
jgi:hypothetical protein